MIPLRIHNILDYVGGGIMLLSPYLLGFSFMETPRNTFWVLGAALILYSLVTRYPYSIAKLIPVDIHMGMDVVVALLLMVAPWALGYSSELTNGQLGLHFVLGVGLLAIVAFTDRVVKSMQLTLHNRNAA